MIKQYTPHGRNSEPGLWSWIQARLRLCRELRVMEALRLCHQTLSFSTHKEDSIDLCSRRARSCQKGGSWGRCEHWRRKEDERSRHGGSCTPIQMGTLLKGGLKAHTSLSGPDRALQRNSPGRRFCVSTLSLKVHPPGLQCTDNVNLPSRNPYYSHPKNDQLSTGF